MRNLLLTGAIVACCVTSPGCGSSDSKRDAPPDDLGGDPPVLADPVPAGAIPVFPCDGPPPNGSANPPFFCVPLGGGALKQDAWVLLDSGNSALILPEDCLAPGSYDVIQDDVKDPWGRDARLVRGSIWLQSQAQTYAVDDLEFYAEIGTSCDDGFKNLGLAQSLFEGWGESQSCAGSFFAMYIHANDDADAVSMHLSGDSPYLLFEQSAPPADPRQVTQLQEEGPIACGGQADVVGYIPPLDPDHDDPAIPYYQATIPFVRFQLGVDDTSLVTLSTTPGASPHPDEFVGMVDSGGGMTIISDDSASYLQTFLSSRGWSSSCPTYPWLQGCTCVKEGLEMVVNWDNGVDASVPALSYGYTVTDAGENQQSAVAVCPLWTYQSPTPYIVRQGANLGYMLFASSVVTLDWTKGTVQVVPR